jgi:hypothetical protein
MTNQPMARFGALFFAFAGLAACSGHQAIDAIPNGGYANGAAVAAPDHRALSSNGNAATGTIVVTLPPIVAASPMPSPGVFLSAGTRSVAGHFGKYTIAPIAIKASTHGCAAQSSGLVCTLRLTVPSGGGSLALQTFGKANGKGLPLAMSSPIPYRVDPGVDNYPRTLPWNGIVRTLRVTVSPPEVTVTVGQNQRTSVVTAYGADASGNAAMGSRIALPDGTLAELKLTQTGFRRGTFPFFGSIQRQLNFNGQTSGKLTFVASQAGKSPVLAPATASLVVRSKPGATGLGSTIVGSGSEIVEFSAGVNGTTNPLRTLFDLPVSRPYGTDAQGNFWMNNARYSNTGKLLGAIKLTNQYVVEAGTTDAAGNVFAVIGEPYEEPCNSAQNIVEYAAGDYSGKTIRKIPYNACTADAIAVDASGFIYTYTADTYDSYPTPTISKWPANASGNVSPISSLTVPAIANMVSNASGNLYAIELAQQSPTAGTLVKFASGSSTPQTVLPGVSVAGFAMDASGNTYAEVPTSTNAFQVEEFAPGSTTPSNTISSSSLTTPMGIAVVP